MNNNKSTLFRNSYYGGKASIYSGLKTWAALVYPPKHTWESTSDTVSTLLLAIISGLPIGIGREIRVFHKAIACNLLAQHLRGNTVSIEEVKELRSKNQEIYGSLNYKRLTA